MILGHGGFTRTAGFFLCLLAIALQSCSIGSVPPSLFSGPLTELEIPAQQSERLYRGDMLFRASRYEDTRKIYLRVLEDQEASPETSASALYMTLYRLATLAEVGRQYDAAIHYYKKADRLLTRQNEAREDELKQIEGYLGALFLAKGMLGANRSELRKQLALYNRVSAGKHPFIGFCHHQLGRLAVAEGDREPAESHFKQSLVSLEQNITPDHPYLAVVMDDYRKLLLEGNRKEEAELLRERSASIRERYPEKQRTALYSEGITLDPS